MSSIMYRINYNIGKFCMELFFIEGKLFVNFVGAYVDETY